MFFSVLNSKYTHSFTNRVPMLHATSNFAINDDSIYLQRARHLSEQIEKLLDSPPICDIFDCRQQQKHWENALVAWCMTEKFYDLKHVWSETPCLNYQEDFCKQVATKKGEYACLMKTLSNALETGK
jgi:hypothetical protein